MALSFTTTLRNNMLDEITTLIDAGAGAGLIRIYDNSAARPSSANDAVPGPSVLLAELTCSDPSAAAAASGLLDLSAITEETSALATGTALWFRVVDSNGNAVVDGDVGTSGSDLNLDTTSITTGQEVRITNFDITAGNA